MLPGNRRTIRRCAHTHGTSFFSLKVLVSMLSRPSILWIWSASRLPRTQTSNVTVRNERCRAEPRHEYFRRGQTDGFPTTNYRPLAQLLSNRNNQQPSEFLP